jgi:hypothetical protein
VTAWLEHSSFRALRERPLDMAALALLGLALNAATMLLGAVGTQPLALVLGLLWAAAACVYWAKRTSVNHSGVHFPRVAAGLMVLSVYTIAQATPIPQTLLGRLSPRALESWLDIANLLGTNASAAFSISLDPHATLLEVLRLGAQILALGLAAHVARTYGSVWIVALLFLSGVLLALVTLGHGLLGMTLVYGVYQPSFAAEGWRVGPLLNPNNLSAALNFATFCGLGLMLMHRPILPKAITGAGVAALIGVSVISGSRGGLATLLLAALLLAILSRWTKEGRIGRRDDQGVMGKLRNPVVAMVLVVTAAGLLVWLGASEGTLQELQDRDLAKLKIAAWVSPMLRAFPLVGVGRGAFAVVSPEFQLAAENALYTHAENMPLQWLADWGLVVGAMAITGYLYLLRPRRVGVGRSMLATSVWCGVVGWTLHNLVDLGSEVPGVALPIWTALGALWGDRQWTASTERDPRLSGRRGWVGAGLVGGLVLHAGIAGFLLTQGSGDVARMHRDVHARFRVAAQTPAPAGALGALQTTLRTELARRPTDPYLGRLMAWATLQAGDGDPIRWVNFTLRHSALEGRAHLISAEVLANRGNLPQAMLELRSAAENEGNLVNEVGRIVLARTRSFELIQRAIPAGQRGAAMVEYISGELTRLGQDPALQRRLDLWLIELSPEALTPRVREARRLIQGLRDKEGVCLDRQACLDAIKLQADAVARVAPNSSWGMTLLGEWMVAKGDPLGAIDALSKGCLGFVDPEPCLRQWVMAASQVTPTTPLVEAGRAYLTKVCSERVRCANESTWVADIHRGRGESATAASILRKVADQDSTAERWLAVLRVLAAAPDAGDARTVVGRLEVFASTMTPEQSQEFSTLRSTIAGASPAPNAEALPR